MDKNEDHESAGLNQLFEIINAKGDEGELKEIVSRTSSVNKNDTVDKSETT